MKHLYEKETYLKRIWWFGDRFHNSESRILKRKGPHELFDFCFV